MKTDFIPILLVILAGLLVSLPSTHAANESLYFIDAHSQADQTIDLDEILELMERAGVKHTILSARRNRKPDTVARFAEQHPDKISAAIRTKSRHYKNNSDTFYERLENQSKDPRYKAMGELLLFHAEKGSLADELVVYPDDVRVRTATKIAIKHNLPILLHIEFAALNGLRRKRFMSKLEEFLRAYAEYPIGLMHMGQLSAKEAGRMISQYPKLFFLTSHSNSIAVQRSNQPWTNLFKGADLAPEWQALMISTPERFVFAVDNVWPSQWRNGYIEQVALWRKALATLPQNVAHAIAHGNAERLWQLKTDLPSTQQE